MTEIKPVTKTATKNYGQESVDEFWLERSAENTPVPVFQENNFLQRIQACLDSNTEDGVICIFSEALSNKIICETIAKARDNGNRIYILTNEINNEMKNLEGCLIRYGGNKRLGSFILINPNSDVPAGCLFTAGLSEGSINLPASLLLDLEKTQIATLFRYFCYQFWNKTEKERIGKEERDTGAAPLDIYPPVEDSCDFQYLTNVWNRKAENTLIATNLLAENSYINFSQFSNATVLARFDVFDANLIRSLKQNGNEIYIYVDYALNNYVISSTDIWLIPKIDSAPEEEVYAVELNQKQREQLEKHIKTTSQGRAKYQYFTKDTRVNLSGKTIFYLTSYDVSKKFTINPEDRITVQPVSPSELLPREEFENLKPDFADDGRSVLITYEWTNIPYTLPSGSKKQQLYKDWENAEKAIIKYIDDILNDITEIEKKENKFSRLIQFVLGKKQKFSEYRRDLENLKTIKYGSIEKAELEGHIKRINAIRSLVEKDSSEIEEANRKAEIEEKIEARQEEVKKREGERDDKEKELQEKQKAIETQSALQESLQKETNRLNSEKKLSEDEIASLQAKIKQSAEDEQKPLEAALADKQNSLKEKENAIAIQSEKQKELKKQLDDLKVAKNKITNEIDDKKDRIKKLNNEINSLKEQIKSPVKAKQNDKSSLSNLKGGGKTSNQVGPVDDLSVPQFPHLPHTGELFQHNGQNYLAIAYWEEYNNGKEEAERLQAKLCAKGENNG